MSDPADETKEEYIVPMGAQGRIVGPCTNQSLPDADKRLIVEFIIDGTPIQLNMHVDELAPEPPNHLKRPRSQ